MKKSFIIYLDSLSVLDKLTTEQSGELFLAIRNYQKNGQLPTDFWLQIAIEPFVNQFKRDDEKYKEISLKRSELGRKGGLAKATKSKQKKAKRSKPADNDNDNVSDNDNEKGITPLPPIGAVGSVQVPYTSEEFTELWTTLMSAKKWKSKTTHALELSMKRLLKNPEYVACEMMRRTIEGGWQGFFDLKEWEIKKLIAENQPKQPFTGVRKPEHDQW